MVRLLAFRRSRLFLILTVLVFGAVHEQVKAASRDFCKWAVNGGHPLSEAEIHYFQSEVNRRGLDLETSEGLRLAFLQIIRDSIFNNSGPSTDKLGRYFSELFIEKQTFAAIKEPMTPLTVVLDHYRNRIENDKAQIRLDMYGVSENEVLGRLFTSGYPILSRTDLQALINLSPSPLPLLLLNQKVGAKALDELRLIYVINKEIPMNPLFIASEENYAQIISEFLVILKKQQIIVKDIWRGMEANRKWIAASPKMRLAVFNSVDTIYATQPNYQTEILNYKFPDGSTPIMQALVLNDEGLFRAFKKAGADLNMTIPFRGSNDRWDAGQTVEEVGRDLFPDAFR